MDLLRDALLALGLLATALAAGFFYAYSVSVVPGLTAAGPDVAVPAMQAINAGIRTPVFAFAFFGALVFPLLAGLAGLAGLAAGGRRTPALLALAATVVYGVGVFAVTFAVNIPLNEALAAAGTPATPAEAAASWGRYAPPWTAWNHVRTLASILAGALLAAALVAAFRPGPTPGQRPMRKHP